MLDYTPMSGINLDVLDIKRYDVLNPWILDARGVFRLFLREPNEMYKVYMYPTDDCLKLVIAKGIKQKVYSVLRTIRRYQYYDATVNNDVDVVELRAYFENKPKKVLLRFWSMYRQEKLDANVFSNAMQLTEEEVINANPVARAASRIDSVYECKLSLPNV